VKDAGDIYLRRVRRAVLRRVRAAHEPFGGWWTASARTTRRAEEVKEANYFFKMSRYQKALVEHIEKNPTWIRPERYRQRDPVVPEPALEDLCISRPRRASPGESSCRSNRNSSPTSGGTRSQLRDGLSAPRRQGSVRPLLAPHATNLIARTS